MVKTIPTKLKHVQNCTHLTLPYLIMFAVTYLIQMYHELKYYFGSWYFSLLARVGKLPYMNRVDMKVIQMNVVKNPVLVGFMPQALPRKFFVRAFCTNVGL